MATTNISTMKRQCGHMCYDKDARLYFIRLMSKNTLEANTRYDMPHQSVCSKHGTNLEYWKQLR